MGPENERVDGGGVREGLWGVERSETSGGG